MAIRLAKIQGDYGKKFYLSIKDWHRVHDIGVKSAYSL